MRNLFFTFVSVLTALSCFGQNCDDIQIELYVDPTDPSILLIESFYDWIDEGQVNYPSFDLYMDDELLGEAETFYFVLAGSQIHFIQLEELFLPGEEVEIELVLFGGFGSEELCTFTWNGIPYEDSDCAATVFTFSIGDQESEELTITIVDLEGNVILSETEFFQPTNPFYSESLCLEKGCYVITVQPTEGNLEQPYYMNFTTENNEYTLKADFIEADQAFYETTLEIWEGCVISVEEESAQKIQVYPNPTKANGPVQFSNLEGIDAYRVVESNGQLSDLQSVQGINTLSFQTAGMRWVQLYEKGELVQSVPVVVID